MKITKKSAKKSEKIGNLIWKEGSTKS